MPLDRVSNIVVNFTKENEVKYFSTDLEIYLLDLLLTRFQKLSQGLKMIKHTSDEIQKNYSDPESILPDIIKLADNDQVLLKKLETALMKQRTLDIFNLITAFPDSKAVLQELRYLVDKYSSWKPLVEATKEILVNRICSPHVSTADLISCYVYAVHVFGFLETEETDGIPRGPLLSALKPLEDYLHSRNDTVIEIVRSMLDEETDMNKLAIDMNKLQNDHITEENFYEEQMKWKPSKPGGKSSQNSESQPRDLLSLMLNLYGSCDKFIKTYQRLLVSRLLNTFQSMKSMDMKPSQCESLEAERRNLELLQSRFERNSKKLMLDSCRVMFKDVDDSLRFYKETKKYQEDSLYEIQALLISEQCWTSIKDILPNGNFKVPLNEEISNQLEKFNQNFKKVKGNRYLQFYHHLSTITIDLDLEDGNGEFQITCEQPALTVLDLFCQKSSWNLVDLVDQSKMPRINVQKYLNFWKQKYVILSPSKNKHLLAMDERSIAQRKQIYFMNMEMQTSTNSLDSYDYNKELSMDINNSSLHEPTNSKPDWEKAFDQYWNLMKNIIMPMGKASIELLHKRLAVFARIEPDSDESEEDEIDSSVLADKKKLKLYLAKKIKENMLVLVDEDKYALVR